MSDIELVIKIPEEIYQKIKGTMLICGRANNKTFNYILFNAVSAGTPLPKGHGRIIDESEITKVYYHEEKAEHGRINFRGIVIDGTDAPTIIEADKAESEE